MGKGTAIQWCDDTWNPWRGCRKVSTGCDHCYIIGTVPFRTSGQKHGAERKRASAQMLRAPHVWNLRPWICEQCGQACQKPVSHYPRGSPNFCFNRERWHRRRVFSLSLGDWLDREVSIEWLAHMLKTIHDTPNLDWLLLTKRLGHWKERLSACLDANIWGEDEDAMEWLSDWIDGIAPPENVWMGASVENQKCAEERIPQLVEIPAHIRFLSVEPMLEPIDLRLVMEGANDESEPSFAQPTEYGQCLDWIIFGGESGPEARPCNIDWIRDGVRQCRAAGVAPFVKQLGSYSIFDFEPGQPAYAGKLRDSKGGDLAEWPEDLRCREFPVLVLAESSL